MRRPRGGLSNTTQAHLQPWTQEGEDLVGGIFAQKSFIVAVWMDVLAGGQEG